MVKYKWIAEEIRKQIRAGFYPSESRLPDQETLAKQYNTSRMTIKKALDLLSSAGIIYTIQGSGSYVKRDAVELANRTIHIGQNVGLTTATGADHQLSAKVLQFSVRFPSETEAELLRLERHEPVYEIERLRILDDKPHSLEYTLFPVALVPNLTEEVLHKSIYRYIREELKLEFGESRQTVRASMPSRDDKEHLLCADDDPVLEVEKINYLENGTPLEYSRVHHRHDMVEMHFVNRRGPMAGVE